VISRATLAALSVHFPHCESSEQDTEEAVADDVKITAGHTEMCIIVHQKRLQCTCSLPLTS